MCEFAQPAFRRQEIETSLNTEEITGKADLEKKQKYLESVTENRVLEKIIEVHEIILQPNILQLQRKRIMNT